MTGLKLFDHLGRPVTLGPLLGKGGEGAVFEIANNPELAAKLYDPPKPPNYEGKLRAMIALARKELCDVAAWPTATLHERPGGPLRGLVMRKIKGFKDIHFLYSPAHRKVTFPDKDWRFLVHTAMNCAAAFDTIHASGVVIADVNFGNVLVSSQGLVALVDCDSYQVQPSGQSFLCDVGIDLFTPPELQGLKSFRGVVRTPNHDRFGLAVLIFYLLFMNRHPYAGHYLGQGDMSINQSIAEHRFAFGRFAKNYLMKPPPQAPTLEFVSNDIANLFELAFSSGSMKPNARPTPRQWVTALKSFKDTLRTSCSDPGHLHGSHQASCPWCGLMGQNAPNFFVSVAYSRNAAGAGGAGFVLAVVWARIDAVPRPNVSYARPKVPTPIVSPWPNGIGRVMLPMPLPPGALRSPPTGPGIPQKPGLPAILTSPPSPLFIEIGRPTREREKVKRTSSQVAIGVSAICSGLAIVLLLGFGAVFGLAGKTGTGAVLALLALGPLGILVGFGAWWLVQESHRKQLERQSNLEYDTDLFALQAKADQKLAIWKGKLAEKQATARERYRQEVSVWENQIAGIQEVARFRYDREVIQWKGLVNGMQVEAQRRRSAMDDAKARLDVAEQEWKAASARFVADFDTKKDHLRQLRDRHEVLGRQYVAERQSLQSRVKETQLTQHLQKAFISDHDISDIARGRKAALSSYGIETAYDISEEKVYEVPGFGAVYTARLLEWRRTIESEFKYDAAAGVPVQQQQALDSKYSQERQRIEMTLLSGEAELKAVVTRSNAHLAQQFEAIKSLVSRLGQSKAEVGMIPPGV